MAEDDPYADKRRRLLDEIEQDARDTAFWTGRKAFSGRTMAAIAAVPRHEFVQPGDEVVAYINRPQPIGHGQTISQPFIVALMTDLLDLNGTEKVLEIGTGCGYQAAVLSRVAARVHTVEVVEELGRAAGDRFKRLGVDNVYVRIGDGYAGWPEEAPFDAIIVTAAPARIPDALIRQLRPGGRMILPVGRAHDRQTLTRVVKTADGRVRTEPVLSVAFVPMVSARPNDREKKAND
ncbi:MAG TPA: protein-L-isoaspartate O-methyltransferase [Rhodospirillaceae bacterium]|nr:protein-L-isoaspartate O-methyltransferase [Rhodospirillaceae bacterium]|tara:strand:+ start:203 stop:907 length:705 start_codon:yes stop_codon:yes gene_type:complete